MIISLGLIELVLIMALVDDYRMEKLQKELDKLYIQTKLTECQFNCYQVEQILKKYDNREGK